jgi:hypothetical protein
MKNKIDLTVEMLGVDPELSSKTLMRTLRVTRPYAYNLLSQARKRMREEESKSKLTWVDKSVTPADMVNNPPHYKVGGLETIDFIEAKNLNYRLGNVVKYITRADHKGDRTENLKKALWYLERELAAAN